MLLSHKDSINDKTFLTAHSLIQKADAPTGGPSGHLGPGIPVADCAAISVAPSGQRKVVFKAGDKTTNIEIWRGHCKVQEVEVQESLHGPIVCDNYFSIGPTWSWDEQYVAYVAEVRCSFQAGPAANCSFDASGAEDFFWLRLVWARNSCSCRLWICSVNSAV